MEATYTREKINKLEFHELARDYFREPSQFHNADLRCRFASPGTAEGRATSFAGLVLLFVVTGVVIVSRS